MNESVTKRRPREADDNQARRTERGIVAGYLHELSRRHDNHRRAEPRVELTATAEGS